MNTNSVPVANPQGIRNVALLSFLFLFPGFFFYQTLIGIAAIKPFLGGYFSVVSVGVFLMLLYVHYTALDAGKYRTGPTDLKFAIFLIYFTLVVTINAAFGADRTTVQTHILSILFFVNIYIIFKNIEFSQRKTIAMALVSFALMSALIFFFSQGGSFKPGRIGSSRSEDSIATYQEFARSYLLTFVTLICFARGILGRLVLYLVGTAALFLNGSRTELIGAVFLIPFVELYRTKTGLRALILMLMLVGVFAVDTQSLATLFPESRVWEIFDLSHSQSAQSRIELTQQALHTIDEHPLLGDYGSYPPGAYAHNILSAWVDLGLFGFLYLIFMLLHTACRLFVSGWLVRARSSQFLLAWALISIAVLFLVTAKTFDDMVSGAAMGAYANYCDKRRGAGTSRL